jgi:anthranilate/para-aminobenzoate synthase component I
MPAFVRLDSDGHSPTWNLAPHCAQTILRCHTATLRTSLTTSGTESRHWSNPLDALSWLAETAAIELENVRWVGYLSYDLGRLFEKIPIHAVDDLQSPLFCFARCAPNHAEFSRPACGPIGPRPASGPAKLRSTFSRDEYLTAVDRAIAYIRAGDVFQVNLSQRFTLPLPASATEIADRLRHATPARYGAFLDFGDHALICNSPELFFCITPNRRIITRPIKGTRPLAPGMDQELKNSIKDQAELNMIVDLERNDLGRICETGSVKVTEPRVIESHPTVYHGAATIKGTLRAGISFVHLLRAVFPGGSITGAPKIRAMEIIEELEPVRRGPYCGAIGYLARGGAMEFNIAIRTMIAKHRLIHIPVGGGIVADSDPLAEYEETLVKARAMFDALDFPLPG